MSDNKITRKTIENKGETVEIEIQAGPFLLLVSYTDFLNKEIGIQWSITGLNGFHRTGLVENSNFDEVEKLVRENLRKVLNDLISQL